MKSQVRVFRREEVLSETTEADRVTHLENLEDKESAAAGVGTKWAYGLANGEPTQEGKHRKSCRPRRAQERF